MPDTLTHEPAGSSRSRARRPPRDPRPRAEWLVLAYLAADNDLEGELLADLAEMERVGLHARCGRGPRPGRPLAPQQRRPGQLAWHPPLLRHTGDGSAQDQLPPPGRPRPDQHRRSGRAGELHHVRRQALPGPQDGAGPPEPRLRVLRAAGDAVRPPECGGKPPRRIPRDAASPAADLPHDPRAPARRRAGKPGHRLRRRRRRLPRQRGAEARAGHGAPSARPQGRPGRHGRLPHDDDRGGVPAPRARRGPRGLGGGRAGPGLAPRGDPRRPDQAPDHDGRRSSAPRLSSATSSPIATRGRRATQSAIDLGQLDELVAAVDQLARELLAAIEDRLGRRGAARRAPPDAPVLRRAVRGSAPPGREPRGRHRARPRHGRLP